MLTIFLMRDVARDCGYFEMIWYWCSTKDGLDICAEAQNMLFRYRLGKQNLVSELLAVLVIPLIIVVDLIFSAIGFGVDTITFELSTDDKLRLLQLYGVLFIMQVLANILITHLLNRQLADLRARVRVTSVVTADPYDKIRLRIYESKWKEQRKYWNNHRLYFALVVSFSVMTTFFRITQLVHL